MINFTVYGEPVAQGRVRATTINGKPRMYDPSKSKDYKHDVRLAAKPYAPNTPLEDPLCLKLKIYKPTLKSFSKKKKEEAESEPSEEPSGD